MADERKQAGRRGGDGLSAGERSLLTDLREAAAGGELTLTYQRQVAPDGALKGLESLLRWTHPRRGIVDPALFIPLAERAGAIRPVTRWVLERAMTETASLGHAIGFNASALEFADPAFAGEVAALVAAHRFDPARLEIEVTETAVLDHSDEVQRTMEALHALGVRIALDDFGVGYSSLNALRLYPFDKLKIDRCFIVECVHSKKARALVAGLVAIGHELGMSVVAEGVETADQREVLIGCGVDAMQGYLFGEPQPVVAFSA